MGAELEAVAAISQAGRSTVGETNAGRLAGSSGYEYVDADPDELAASAGVPLEVYALARCVQSEAGDLSSAAQLAVAETTRNEAARRGSSIASMLLHAKSEPSSGHFGRQASGRWASTFQVPTERSIVAAQQALAGSELAARATDFFDPLSQDGGTQAGVQLRHTSTTYIEKIYGEGLRWVGPVQGINPRRLFLSSRMGVYDLAAGLEAASTGATSVDDVVAEVGAAVGVSDTVVKVASVLVVAGLIYFVISS